eukprot:360908-Chlamydomonas_euryale.AAC.9
MQSNHKKHDDVGGRVRPGRGGVTASATEGGLCPWCRTAGARATRHARHHHTYMWLLHAMDVLAHRVLHTCTCPHVSATMRMSTFVHTHTLVHTHACSDASDATEPLLNLNLPQPCPADHTHTHADIRTQAADEACNAAGQGRAARAHGAAGPEVELAALEADEVDAAFRVLVGADASDRDVAWNASRAFEASGKARCPLPSTPTQTHTHIEPPRNILFFGTREGVHDVPPSSVGCECNRILCVALHSAVCARLGCNARVTLGLQNSGFFMDALNQRMTRGSARIGQPRPSELRWQSLLGNARKMPTRSSDSARAVTVAPSC